MYATRTRIVRYTGDVWEGPAVHPVLWELLLQTDLLIELFPASPPCRVVLGVPHHAAPGTDGIAEDWVNPRTGRRGRPADETTGLVGLALFTALREEGISCKLVIAAHPTDHDPNKLPGSPYWVSVFADPLPGLLFELHGAGRHRRHTLELSAGKNERVDPLAFGTLLARSIHPDWSLAVQVRPGAREARVFNPDCRIDRLENPALSTRSLSHAGQLGLPALHLEMKAFLRQPDPAFPGDPRPPAAAWQLARALAATIKSFDPLSQ